MKLDRKERFIIANQLKILEALYPDEASFYAIERTAFEKGYEFHYDWAMENIYDDTLKKEESQEVINTLDMFRAIQHTFKSLKDKTGIEKYSVKFSGYDGNDLIEGKLLGYARYFVIELGRFKEILEEMGARFDFNSHQPMRGKYQRMLQVWMGIESGTQLGQKFNLTREQLIQIIEA